MALASPWRGPSNRVGAFLFRAVVITTPLLLAGAGLPACEDDGGAMTPPPAAKSSSLKFDVEGVLTVAPGQRLEVKILAPDSNDQVSVGLEGAYLDGSLGRSEIPVASGVASVSLRAPTAPTTFSMRAKLAGSNDARLDVSVSASGFATVRIATRYTGRRSATAVVGSIFLSSSCPELAKAELRDGAPKVSGTIGDPLVIPSVPAGTRVAVSIRAGHYADGCIDLEPLAPLTTRDVSVDIFDRAVALERTNLQAVLTMEPEKVDRQAWDATLDAAAAKALGVFVPEGTAESTALLDAMQAAAPASATTSFSLSRGQNNYETKASAWLTAHGPTLRARATAWVNAAKPDAFGDIGFHLDPGKSAGLAEVTVQTFGLFAASASGVTTRVPFGWTADASTGTPDDTVHLSGSVYVSPTALVTYAADRRATIDVPGSKGVATALATQIDCAGLATALVAAGTSYPGCAATCTAILCAAGIDTMWTRAHEASAATLDVMPIGLTASARADVGDFAEPVAFAGAWVGQVTVTGGQSFALKGVAKAAYGTTAPK